MSIFDRFKKDKEITNKVEESNSSIEKSKEILKNPISGEVKDVKECQDQVFSQEMVGKGALIIPSEGKLYSPVDGKISMLAETGHAVGITSASGLEILIHVGLDTVELNGEPFKLIGKNGDDIKAGDPILEFDIEKIKASEKPIESPFIITNPDSYDINIIKFGNSDHGEGIIEVTSK